MNLSPRSPALSFLLAAAIGTAAGCAASHRPASAAADVPPPGFLLGVTVLTPPGSSDPAPARHIMEPDWVLRSEVGSGVTPASFPLRTRQLSHAQAAELWRLLASGPLARTPHPAEIGAWPTDAPPPRRPVYVLEFKIDGEHRVLAIDAEAGEDAEAARAIAERLGELAWLR